MAKNKPVFYPADYNGKYIDSRTPIHDAQQIHKYRLGLFVTGIVALAAAAFDLILIAMFIANGSDDKGISSGITSMSIIFVIALLVDVIFTANLNRYVNDKRWLWLYIPSLVLMILFSVPQIMGLIKLIVPGIAIPDPVTWQWANYINIACCGAFIIVETVRMIIHRNDINLKQELIQAWK